MVTKKKVNGAKRNMSRGNMNKEIVPGIMVCPWSGLPEVLQSARRHVARHSRDPDDFAELLAILGIQLGVEGTC